MVFVLLAVSLPILYAIYRLKNAFFPPKHLRHLKGPNFVSMVLGLIFSPYPGPYLQRMGRDRFGRIHRQYFGTWSVMIHDHEEAVKEVMKNPDVFEKFQGESIRSESSEMFFGVNIVSENGEKWQRLRRICNPAFHWEYLRSFIDRFTNSTQKVFQYIDNNNILQTSPKIKELLSKEQLEDEGKKFTTVEVVPLMQKLTLDILGDCAFSVDFGSFDAVEGHDSYVSLYNRIMKNLFTPMNFLFKHYDKLPLASNRKVKTDIRTFKTKLQDVINKRREELKSGVNVDRAPDLLDMMIQNEGGMTDDELQYNANIFFLAGHDTTSTTLSMALNFLALNPDVQDRAREEARAVLEGKPPSYDAVKELTYITQIIKETLRIWPPVSILPARVSTKEVTIDGHQYPKDTVFTICTYNLHHSSEYWENPEKFDPDRFAPNKKISAYTWLPFGTGPRVCIGNNFSMQEQRVFLAMILLRYRVHPGPVIPSKQQKLTGLNFELPTLNFLLPRNLFLRFERISE